MLCRACGNEMVEFEYCHNCNEAIHWKCSTCYKENEKSIHTNCTKQQEEFLKTISSVDIVSSTSAAVAATAISIISLCVR
jgi:hypothetical protein